METTLTIGSPITSTGPGSAIDASGWVAPYTLRLQVLNLIDTGSTAPTARIQFEDSPDGGVTWTPIALQVQQGPVTGFTGSWDPAAPSGTWPDLPGLNAGAAGCMMRINVTQLTGASPQLTIKAMVSHS
jgi:hypothetical protein